MIDFFVQCLKVLLPGRTVFCDRMKLDSSGSSIECFIYFIQKRRFNPGCFPEDDYGIKVLFIQRTYGFCQVFVSEYFIQLFRIVGRKEKGVSVGNRMANLCFFPVFGYRVAFFKEAATAGIPR